MHIIGQKKRIFSVHIFYNGLKHLFIREFFTDKLTDKYQFVKANFPALSQIAAPVVIFGPAPFLRQKNHLLIYKMV